MAFTTESIEAAPVAKSNTAQNDADLPIKEFVGYDPKGKTTVTGTQIIRPEPANVKQESISVGTKEPEESVTLSPKISAIARKEQATRQREAALIQREKALEAKLADAEKYTQIKSKLASKDFSAAEELGLSYEEYVQYKLNKETQETPEEQRFRKVETELSNFKKAQEEQTVKEYQANQALWKNEISRLVAENEAFSSIKELGAEDIVLQHVNDSFDEDGVELTAEQAAQEIEDALVARAEKFASIPKIKNKTQEAKVLPPPKSSPKTITQNMTVSSQKHVSKPFHQMSESEQLAEAYRRVQAQKLNR